MPISKRVTALVLPDPERSPLPAIRSRCREIYEHRDDVIGVLDLEAANASRLTMGAIEKFVGNREGRDDVRRSARILECAVGAALGEPSVHHDRRPAASSLAREVERIPADDRYRCRLMFQYRDVWEPELVTRGLSRSQVLTLIRLKRQRDGDRHHGSATVDLADWQTWIAEQPDCDLLLTDPPYATDVLDVETFAHDWMPLALARVKPTGRAYICIGAYPNELAAYLDADRADMTLAQVLVWTYRNTLGPAPSHDYKQNWQAILYFRGTEAPPLESPLLTEQFSVQDINAPDARHGERFHPWQKPDELAERFIRHATRPGDLVMDPFAGTGTFLVAAAKLGRDAIGCDSDSEQVNVCITRGCTRGRVCAA
jgi:hypothetical protein